MNFIHGVQITMCFHTEVFAVEDVLKAHTTVRLVSNPPARHRSRPAINLKQETVER